MADRVDLPIEGAGGHEGMRWAATKGDVLAAARRRLYPNMVNLVDLGPFGARSLPQAH
jgi:hypothetical protein